MKKFILIILLCMTLAICFVACDTTDNTPDGAQPPEQETPDIEEPTKDLSNDLIFDEKDSELNNIFLQIQEGLHDESKIRLNIENQDSYYKIKDSGEYNDEIWGPSVFTVIIKYDIDRVKNTEWYKNSLEKDRHSINNAFYNNYNSYFQNGLSPSGIAGDYGLMLIYYYGSSDFISDYNMIKTMQDFDFVKSIIISFRYGMPINYGLE